MPLDPKVDKLLNSRDFLPQTMFPQEFEHIKGSPVVVPLSLSFEPNPNPNSTDPWEIFGTIIAVFEDIVIEIYDLKPRDADRPTRDINSLLRLSDPICHPIASFFPDLPFEARLFDVKHKQVLFNRTLFSLDYRGYTNYDKVDYKIVEGDRGKLHMKYITYQAAVFARVKIVLKKKDEGDAGKVLAVEGSIIGSWFYDANDISLHSDHDETECSCISVMNPNMCVTLGKPVDLIRPLLAMPAYSLLAVHVNLNVSEHGNVNSVVVMPAADSSYSKEIIQGPNGLLCEVDVRFFHEYDFFDGVERKQDAGSETSSESKGKKMKVHHNTNPLSPFTVFSNPTSVVLNGGKLIEVFSIMIGGKNENDIFNIHGRIRVTDRHHKELYIYDKDQGNVEIIQSKRNLSLEGPHDRCFVLSGSIEVEVDLKDGDRHFCKGFLYWSNVLAKKIWVDAHVCSVIKGEHGYAAVHYVIYSSAVQAIVKVYLISPDGLTFRSVSGKIATEHSYIEYDTFVEKEYYRGVVFSRTPESAALLLGEEEDIPVLSTYVESGASSGCKTPKLLKATGIPLPLCKSVVCVSDDASLVFDLNLSAMVETEDSQAGEVVFSGRAECKIGCQMCLVFQNDGSQVCLLVDWRSPKGQN